MPLYNPNVIVVPIGSIIENEDTKEQTTITDTKSLYIGTTIYCTKATFNLMLKDVNEDHPDFSAK